MEPALQAANGYLIVEPAPAEEKTAGGLFIPDDAREKPSRGTVLDIGAPTTADGRRTPFDVGDTVYYSPFGGAHIEGLLVLSHRDVLAWRAAS